MEFHDVFFLLIICMALSPFTFMPLFNNHTESYDVPLQTLSDTLTIQGSFSLGSGSIDGEPVYLYYWGDDIKGFKLGHKNAEDCTIFRDEENKPYLKITELCSNNVYGIETCFEKSYEFHVPKNTIVSRYNLDGE